MSADNREEPPEISFCYLAASKVALDDVCERAAVVKRVYGAVNAEVDLFLISYVDRQLLNRFDYLRHRRKPLLSAGLHASLDQVPHPDRTVATDVALEAVAEKELP